MAYPTISCNLPNFAEKLIESYDEYGVCVITDVIDSSECNNIMDNIVTNFEKLGTGIDRNNHDTWDTYRTPVQTRCGMYQTAMANLPIFWKTKTRPEIINIFEILYSKLRNTTDLIVSNDGLNIKPARFKPFHKDNPKYEFEQDWAHIDQTINSDPYTCIQGQLVMTNTTAAFRCTPKSHKHLDKILNKYNLLSSPANWCKFNLNQKKEIKDLMAECGCNNWQEHIYAPQGSFIVWSSAMIHSAKFADKPVNTPKDDIWKGWRGVLYISYRPRSDMTTHQIGKKIQNIIDNRVMNHWGNKTFPLVPGGMYQQTIKRHPIIDEITKEPKKIYDILGIDINEIINEPTILKYIT